MIAMVQSPCPLRASRNLPPAEPPSAKMWRRKPVADGLEQRRCSVSILPIGRMNKDDEHDAKRVSDDVALAAVDLFPGVVAR